MMMWCPRCQKNVNVASSHTEREVPGQGKVRDTHYRCTVCRAALGRDTAAAPEPKDDES